MAGVVLEQVVGGLVVAEEQEGLLPVPLRQPVEAQVGDNIGDMALVHPAQAIVVDVFDGIPVIARLQEAGVPVHPLGGEHPVLVEAPGVGVQVPLAHHRRLVALLPEQGREGDGVPRQGVYQGLHPVDMGVLPGQDGGPAGGAQGVDAEAVLRQAALPADAVDAWGFEHLGQPGAIEADGVGRVVVRHNKEDIGPPVLI